VADIEGEEGDKRSILVSREECLQHFERNMEVNNICIARNLIVKRERYIGIGVLL
jgi:hypothetical protein